jgi:16S rRNA U1498 N3-methylase RsmE
MQLFVCDFVQKEKEIRITDERIVRQCITVLRMKPGDLLEVQSLDGSVRHVVEITTIAHAGIV